MFTVQYYFFVTYLCVNIAGHGSEMVDGRLEVVLVRRKWTRMFVQLIHEQEQTCGRCQSNWESNLWRDSGVE